MDRQHTRAGRSPDRRVIDIVGFDLIEPFQALLDFRRSDGAGTKHPQEAWALYRFLLSPHAQQVMADRMEKMPSRTSVLKGTYEQAKVAYNRKVFGDALDYAKPPPNIPEWDKVQHLLQEQLDLVYIGKKTVADGARDATAAVNRTLEQMRAKGK